MAIIPSIPFGALQIAAAIHSDSTLAKRKHCILICSFHKIQYSAIAAGL